MGFRDIYIDIVIVVIIEVGGAFTLIVTLYCTRFRTTRFRTTRFRITRFRITKFCTTSEAVDKGIIVYRYNYILSGFNWYWLI